MPRTATNKIANRYGLDTKVYSYPYATGDAPILTIDFANITDIELTSDVVWATGDRNHSNQVPFDEPYQGSFTFQTQCVPLKLIALITNEADTVTGDTGKVTFKNDRDGTASPKFYYLVSETIWKDENGAILDEKMTAYKARPRKNYTASYSGTGDPQSVSVVFDLADDASGNVLDLERSDPNA